MSASQKSLPFAAATLLLNVQDAFGRSLETIEQTLIDAAPNSFEPRDPAVTRMGRYGYAADRPPDTSWSVTTEPMTEAPGSLIARAARARAASRELQAATREIMRTMTIGCHERQRSLVKFRAFVQEAEATAITRPIQPHYARTVRLGITVVE